MVLKKLVSPISSEISNYATASESEFSKKTPQKSKQKRKSFLGKEAVGGDAESISSMDSNISLTPQTNLLKVLVQTMLLK